MVDQDDPREIRKVNVDLSALADAFDEDAWEVKYYLDLETGEVVWTTEEVSDELERIYEGAADSEPGDETGQDTAIGEVLARSSVPTWMKEAVAEADRIETGLGTRYLEIPKIESRDRYGDMEDFIATVPNDHLQARLSDAIRGRGAFRRFRDTLARHPHEEERWHQFRRARAAERATAWLESEGIAPVAE